MPLLQRRTTRFLVFIALLVCGGGFLLPALLGWLDARTTRRLDDTAFRSPEEYDYLLVIGRREERTRENQADIPFRNSPIALYRRGDSCWTKVEGDLMCRSTTTCEERPATPIEVPQKSWGEQYRYGYVSVPYGCFSLVSFPLPSKKSTAFLISDWGRTDGEINLVAPQVIKALTVDSDKESGEPSIIDLPDASRSMRSKRGSSLHPTHTRNWSRGDSYGCINLYKPLEPKVGEIYDYDLFFGWLEEHGLLQAGLPVGLVVMPFEALAAPTSAELPTELPRGFAKELYEGAMK